MAPDQVAGVAARQGARGCCLLVSAHLDAELGAGLHQVRGHVAHAHALLEAGAVAAAGDHADLHSGRVEDGAALARRRALGDDEAAPLARGALVGDLREDSLRADEAAGGAAALGDDPEQRALSRGGRVVQVVAVEAETRLGRGEGWGGG